jgi:hypothetical protein
MELNQQGVTHSGPPFFNPDPSADLPGSEFQDLSADLTPVRTPGSGALAAGATFSTPFAADLYRLAAAPDFDPAQLIEKLKEKPALDFLYAQSARVAEGYSLEEHTLMVLRQYEKYLATVPMPGCFSIAEMRIALALHDIGKPIPAHKRDQHIETVKVIESLRPDLPISDLNWPLMIGLIGGDPLGLMLQGIFPQAPKEPRRAIADRVYRGEVLEYADLRAFADLVTTTVDDARLDSAAANAAVDIKQRANLAGIPPRDFLELLLIYYRADTSAYSYDAWRSATVRGFPGLEYLYALNPAFTSTNGSNLYLANGDGLIFSPRVWDAIEALRRAVQGN